MGLAIYGMIYLGSALMVYNIYHYVRYAKRLLKEEEWKEGRAILFIPIVLLVLFLFGYLIVGIFGNPDIVMSGILFGGSIFVFVIFQLLTLITNRIQENHLLRSELKAAEESSKAKSVFLSGVSHEMRTPLNAIIGFDHIILQDSQLTPETRLKLEGIDYSARRLLLLIDQILNVNSLGTGQLVVRNDPFSLRKTLDLTSLVAKSLCDQKGLGFRFELTDSGMDDRYIGDEDKLSQVFMSLLDNAVKFTEAPGTVLFGAEAAKEEDGRQYFRFKVQDTGIGIDEDYQKYLFEPFSKEDLSSTDRFGGSGLGLALTKGLVDLMGGEIQVFSRKNDGSTFIVTVPLQITEQLPSDSKEGAEGAAADTDSLLFENRRFLIVEDTDLSAELLSDLLEMEGAVTERAENGQVAVELFSKEPAGYFDAILMDLRMPVMNGLDATKAIRSLNRPDAGTIPILALTANVSEEDRCNTREAGMNQHLPKPVDVEQLYDSLCAAVNP